MVRLAGGVSNLPLPQSAFTTINTHLTFLLYLPQQQSHQAKHTNMENQEPGDATTRKRAKQSISIPFVWEEFPGTPKKDWKPTPTLLKLEAPPLPQPPPKYIASIPFKWEEKPGTPLPSFSSHQKENPWVCFDDDDQHGDEIDVQDSSYPETCESESDDSYTSAAAPPSLMANGLISAMAVSNAVPVCPDSPASETESVEAGAASLAGASFLEWLFPLLTPQTKSLEKDDGSAEMSNSRLHARKNGSIKGSFIRPQTLGELIMMSRRFSYQRNAVQMQMPNHPKKFTKRNELVTSIIETTDILGRLQKKWMRQIQLKLM